MKEIDNISSLPRNTDLHTHSLYSDGQMSVGMLLKEAIKRGIKYLSITDHESIAQYEEFLKVSRYSNLEIKVLPGLEISTSFNEEDIHLLVYFNFESSDSVKDIIEPIREEKIKKIYEIIDMMLDAGIYIDKHIMQNGKRTLNRMCIARYIFTNSGFGNIEEVFKRYFERGSQFNIKSSYPPTDEIIKKFSQIGCLVGVAHPEFLKNWTKIKYIQHFIKLGLKGIEVFHPLITEDLRYNLLEFSFNNRLIPLGGSDFHGYDTKRNELGLFNTFDESFFDIESFIEN